MTARRRLKTGRRDGIELMDKTDDTDQPNKKPAESLDELVLQIEQQLIDRIRRGHGLRRELERLIRRALPNASGF